MTIIPLPGPAHADLADAGKASAFFPVAGLVIGLLLSGGVRLMTFFWPSAAVAAAATALWIILTAGLHVDGLADLADGLGGGWDRESRLRIMKDSSIGTYGGLAIVILIMMKAVMIYTVSADLNFLCLLLIFTPVAGRCVQVMSIRIFPPAKKEGFGVVFKAGVGTADAAAALIITIIAGSALLGWYALALLAGAVIFALAAGRWISRRLGGLNGDSYGAVCELTELFILIAAGTAGPVGQGWLSPAFMFILNSAGG